MKNTVKTFAAVAITLVTMSCSGQTSKTEDTNRPQGGPPTYAQLLTEMDANKDGKLSKAEIKGPLQNDFSKVDSNSDGFISKSEFENAPKPEGGGQRPPKK
ncbi:EF-hand domain-containing protein [Arcticibacterium luteifluviistationis]|uniref:EF-hand domain-containing protein n=1 Tax=Arcticibacterium luteifluviistationis TaxID=1784714 RepID=A0A2Z4G8P3_9BACT|nr:EF-hand domain-containing protein [Arcticibacterium luteifluviistationis]AWV97524.1 hypothetical protein DJ013_04830 [Arcticibacterium luteifluviistationis]